MIKDYNLLIKTVLDYLKSQIIISKKDGIVINLDGTLMSAVNVLLAKQLGPAFKYKVIVCLFNQNKYYLAHIMLLLSKLDVPYEIKDLSKDLDTLSLYKNASDKLDLEISIRKRVLDLMINIEGDKNNLSPISNQSYSQWCVEFPHKSYQSLSEIHLLNRLFFSEVQDLARHLGLPETFVSREPSHYLHRAQLDKESLGFTYGELEDYLRNPRPNKTTQDMLINQKLVGDNRSRFLSLPIQRPSNLLG